MLYKEHGNICDNDSESIMELWDWGTKVVCQEKNGLSKKKSVTGYLSSFWTRSWELLGFLWTLLKCHSFGAILTHSWNRQAFPISSQGMGLAAAQPSAKGIDSPTSGEHSKGLNGAIWTCTTEIGSANPNSPDQYRQLLGDSCQYWGQLLASNPMPDPASTSLMPCSTSSHPVHFILCQAWPAFLGVAGPGCQYKEASVCLCVGLYPPMSPQMCFIVYWLQNWPTVLAHWCWPIMAHLLFHYQIDCRKLRATILEVATILLL